MISPAPSLTSTLAELEALLDAQETLRERYDGGMAAMPDAVRDRYEAVERRIGELRAARELALPPLAASIAVPVTQEP